MSCKEMHQHIGTEAFLWAESLLEQKKQAKWSGSIVGNGYYSQH